MGRADYLARRLFFALTTVLVVLTLNFFLFRVLPGDIVTILSRVPNASPEFRDALEKLYGLDKSHLEQYFVYMGQLAHGDLGTSFTYQQPVVNVVLSAAANTVPMVLAGTIVGMALGIFSGTFSAWRRGTAGDLINTNVAVAFWSLPTQWLALVLLVLFAGYLPTNGMSDPFLVNPTFIEHLVDVLSHMILPSLTIALISYGQYTLIVRSALLETLGQDYVLTARAKGLRSRRVVSKHGLRNAMLPIVTLGALSLGRVVGGVILVETVFSWPGVGLLTYQAVNDRDYPVLQGCFLLMTLSMVFFNFVADLLYLRLDPRVTS